MIAYGVNRPVNLPLSARISSKDTANNSAFALEGIAGNTLFDGINGVPAVCSISGTRYGVVNGVVTQFAVNQPPIEDDGLRGCPAFTQLAKMSETLTDAVWTNARTVLSSAGTYNGSNRWKITEDLNTNTHNFIQVTAFAAATDDNVLGVRLIAEYAGRHLAIFGKLRDNTIVVVCTINLITGVISNLRSGCYASVTNIATNAWDVFASFLPGTGANSPFLFWGLSKDDGSTIYGGDGVSGIYVSRPTFVNFGVNGIPFIPPYVPNNTSGSISVVSEAATSTTGTSYDLDNTLLARLKTALRGPNAKGHLELTFKSSVDSGWLTNDSYINILSFNNVPGANGGVALRKTVGGVIFWYFTDPVPNNASIAASITIGQVFKMSFDWGTHSTGQKMRATINGVKSAITNFSGSFGSQDLRFFFGNTVHAGWIVKDSLKISDRPQW